MHISKFIFTSFIRLWKIQVIRRDQVYFSSLSVSAGATVIIKD